MKKCRKCGGIYPDDMKLCGNCGGRLKAFSVRGGTKSEPQQQENPLQTYPYTLTRTPSRDAAPEHIKKVSAPVCPNCKSANIKRIGTLSRALSIKTWGVASGMIGRNMECRSCGYKW